MYEVRIAEDVIDRFRDGDEEGAAAALEDIFCDVMHRSDIRDITLCYYAVLMLQASGRDVAKMLACIDLFVNPRKTESVYHFSQASAEPHDKYCFNP